MREHLKLFFDLFKLRIGLAIGFTAAAGIAVAPGPPLPALEAIALVLAVIVSSAAAGAFNQYIERDVDARMARTRLRPFVTGRLRHGPFWLAVIGAMIIAAVGGAAFAVNPVAAFYVFLGAFFYAVVYTVCLKRRTWWNIVIGGLAGSFAVLAGATAVSPHEIGAVPMALAWMLFFWTPPHFWSLAIAFREDYVAAGIPMLPAVVGERRAARAILAGTVILVASSLVPLAFGMGPIYAAGALAGGGLFLRASWRLAADPGRATALKSFHASLMQLCLTLAAAMADSLLLG